jgi:predicted RNase H-like HicB family nuclease
MKPGQRKHLISARQARKRAAYDPHAPLVLTRRETIEMLEMMENPPPRNAKFVEAMDRYRKHKISEAIATLLQHAAVEQCADTGVFVGKIVGIPGAHSQGETRGELQVNLREVLEMLFESATPRQTWLYEAVVCMYVALPFLTDEVWASMEEISSAFSYYCGPPEGVGSKNEQD